MIKTIIISAIIISVITGAIIIYSNHMDFPAQNQIIRPPAVAGQFYPSDPDELNQIINKFLNNINNNIQNKPQILIAPHAGYPYSGQTAAYAYKALENHKYNTIIILGSSHNYPIKDLALYNGDFIQTPLGNIPVDKKLVQELIQNPNININNKIHEPEHSLEVQLPFLQKILTNNYKIILGLINNDDPELLNSISQTLSQYLSSNLLVISSDLSHYPSYQDAIYSDQKILNAILTNDINIFNKINSEIISQNLPGLDTCACGSTAIKIGILIAEDLNLQGQILNYTNSGDTEIGDKNKVVGYGAVVFDKVGTRRGAFSSEIQSPTRTRRGAFLQSNEQDIALKLARNTLELEFNLTNKKYTDYKNHPIFSEKRGVFVTLNKHGQLRGCIGLIKPIKPLAEAIIEMATSAAFDDSRFNPLTQDELDQINIEISVLTPPQKIDDYNNIKLKKHGVIIRQGSSSGVFLPQVATDTNWTLDEFLSHLCTDKAGLAHTCYQDPRVDIYTFEAQVFEE